jgi:hypothetical protein
MATVGPNFPYSILGTSGSTQRVSQQATVTINAATGTGGVGTPVDLSSAYNTAGTFTDGTSFSGGLDRDGNAYSATLLTASRVLNGVQFNFGPTNAPDAVAGAGQVIALPAGNFSSLQLLGTAINGDQNSQTVVVTYTDGTSAQFQQGFSDWARILPDHFKGELRAVTMPYRNQSGGTQNQSTFSLFGYGFFLDSSKTVRSVTLPNNPNVVVLAATLTADTLADLSSVFNVGGITTDGTTFTGGLDGAGFAYSANLLGDLAQGSGLVANGVAFSLGSPNVSDVVVGTNGVAIPLPAGNFTTLQMLATAVEGNQTAQTLTVTYTDGTSAQFTQSFSDWFTPQIYPGESVALNTSYRNSSGGVEDGRAIDLYGYYLNLDETKTVQSLTLPNNRDVTVLAVTLR